MTHLIVESKAEVDFTMAGNIARALSEAYPGHPWHVDVRDGVLIIKHMRLTNKWGMVRRLDNVQHDFKRLKHEVVMAGGELLERSGLARGEDSGDRVMAVDGIPKKDLNFG